jgi:hypothetical protein
MAPGLAFRRPSVADIYIGNRTTFFIHVISVAAARARDRPAAVSLAVALLTFA